MRRLKKKFYISVFLILGLAYLFFFYSSFPAPDRIEVFNGQEKPIVIMHPKSDLLSDIDNLWTFWYRLNSVDAGYSLDQEYTEIHAEQVKQNKSIVLYYDEPIEFEGMETKELYFVSFKDPYMQNHIILRDENERWRFVILLSNINPVISSINSMIESTIGKVSALR